MLHYKSTSIFNEESVGEDMPVSYDRLWKKLIDEKMNRTELKNRIGVSTTTLAKLGKNEQVSLDVLERICKEFNCNIGDIMDYVGEKE